MGAGRDRFGLKVDPSTIRCLKRLRGVAARAGSVAPGVLTNVRTVLGVSVPSAKQLRLWPFV